MYRLIKMNMKTQKIKEGEIVKIDPTVTGENEWIEGVVIDVENNPFRGVVISIKDKIGRIFWAEKNNFLPA